MQRRTLIHRSLAASALLGGGLYLLLQIACRLSGAGQAVFRQLALCLLPLGGAGLFLGLSATTVKLLRYEGLPLLWVNPTRMALLGAAMAWCLWLGWRVCQARAAAQRLPLFGALAAGVALVGYGWYLQFWGW